MYRPPSAGVPTPLQLLGAPVSLRLTNGELVRGEVFCYDMNGSNTVILKEQKDSDRASFRIVKVQHVREINAHGPPPPSVDSWLPGCNPRVLEEREHSALAAFEAKRHTLGVGVTQEAQEIFNFIHKTHPDCCWTRDRRISVMGVTVNPPYGSEDCEGPGRPLDRIKQVIKRYRQRRETDKTRASHAVTSQQHPSIQNQQQNATGTVNKTGSQQQQGIIGTTPPVAPTQQYLTTTDPTLASSGMTPGAPVDYHQYLTVNPANGIATTATTAPLGIQSPPNGPGVFMMVVHPGVDDGMMQRGGAQQMMTTAQAVPGHPGPFFAPVFIQGQQGPVLMPSAVPQQAQIFDVNGRPMMSTDGAVLCQMNNTPPTCQDESGTPNSSSHLRSTDPSGRPINDEAPPPPETQQQPAPPQQYSDPQQPMSPQQSVGRSPQSSTFNSTNNNHSRPDPSAASDSSSTAAQEVSGGWTTQQRNSNSGKNTRNHQRRSGNRNRREG